jgi:hypothetical protein
MDFLGKLLEFFKRSYAWVATKSPQQADPRICPLCFESITANTRFIRYCPVCKNWEIVKGTSTRELFSRCKKIGCKANRTLAQRPFLAHENCRRMNPLILNLNDGAKNRVQSLDETFTLRWVDPSAPGGRSAPRDVRHWTLPIIHGAAEKVVGVKAMWFPSELLRLLATGKGKRVQLRGPIDVGKSVLSSIVVNPDSLPSNLQVENFVYASPYVATDMNVPEEQRQPFRFFANALQAIQSLRDWQPLDMHNTGPAEALLRAGFYSKIVDRERRALVLYDLAGEHFQEGAGEMVAEQAANSDCIFIMLDITCIPIFEEYVQPQNRKERSKKSQFNARLSASLRQVEGDETPKIIVVTKVDLVEIPKFDRPDFAVNCDNVESKQPEAEEHALIAPEAAGFNNGPRANDQPGNGQRGRPGFNKELALSELAEIKAQVELPSARTSAEIQDLARSNLERLKSFYDPSDPSQKMIRERLDGGNIKGAFFVWTTGLAPVQWSDLPPAAQTEPMPDTASSTDAGLVANAVADASQAIPGSALAVSAAPPIVNAAPPVVADNQPPISCGVLELVKFTLELE